MSDTYRSCGIPHVLDQGSEAHWPQWYALGVTPPSRRIPVRGMYSNSGVATDVTKIIAFRCPEGGTTTFDKTFSAISGAPSTILFIPSRRYHRAVLVIPFSPVCVRAPASPSVSTAFPTRRKRERKWHRATPWKLRVWFPAAAAAAHCNAPSPLADAG